MPGATRKTLDSAGGKLIAGSPDVITNGQPQVRIGDAVEGHGPGEHGGPVMAEGSLSVITNGIPTSRAQHKATCGHPATGSPDVIIGDLGGGGGGETNLDPAVVNLSTPASSLFNTPRDDDIVIDEATSASATSTINSYIANPKAYEISDEQDPEVQVKKRFPGTVDDGGGGQSLAPISSAGDIPQFLTLCLQESNKGCWRESGQGGRPSNPNILNIWQNLGYPAKSPWTTDQTPWCMGFVNFVLKNCGYRYVQTAWAYDIKNKMTKFNATSIPIAQGQPGDIVLWEYGHVNFIYSGGNGKYTFCGGNQSPRVKGNNPEDGDLTVSWPSGWTAARGGIVGIYRPSKS